MKKIKNLDFINLRFEKKFAALCKTEPNETQTKSCYYIIIPNLTSTSSFPNLLLRLIATKSILLNNGLFENSGEDSLLMSTQIDQMKKNEFEDNFIKNVT